MNQTIRELFELASAAGISMCVLWGFLELCLAVIVGVF